MMKIPVWKEGMTDKEAKDVAYAERNLLALLLATVANLVDTEDGLDKSCGWYIHGEWEGWSRVISIWDGKITFHVPDDFDLGSLPQIEPNWDGHSTQEKWELVMKMCGVKTDDNKN